MELHIIYGGGSSSSHFLFFCMHRESGPPV